MAIASIRILVEAAFPSKTVRLYDGSGPFMDGNGNIWRGMIVLEGLDSIESALNGEAYTLNLGLSGIPTDVADIGYQETEDGDVIGSIVRILIQDCDETDQPVGSPEVRFTGTIDNIVFQDAVSGDNPLSSVMIECTNRFSLRNTRSGSVLSYIDQKARSEILNPGAPTDRMCERVPVLGDKTIRWPVRR